MLDYLIQLPTETLGQKLLLFLELIDIVQLEKATASHESQQLLRSILPYFPPIDIPRIYGDGDFIDCPECINWCNKRKCRIQHGRIYIQAFLNLDFQYDLYNDIELVIKQKVSLKDIKPIQNITINQKITRVEIWGVQDTKVMEVLFSYIGNIHSFQYITMKNDFKILNIVFKYCLSIKQISLNNSFQKRPFSSCDDYLTLIAEKCPPAGRIESMVYNFY